MLFVFLAFLTTLLCLPAVTLVAPRRARKAASSVLLGATVAGAVVAASCFWRGLGVAVNFSEFTPLPFALAVDTLSAFFLFLICAVSAPIVLFSTAYVERHYQGACRSWIWALFPWFLLAMVIVVTASTAFAFLFGWELMTLVSAGLVLTDGDSEPRRHNVLIYLLMMHAGAAAVVAAFLLFLPHGAGLDFPAIRNAAAAMPVRLRSTVFVLAFVGFGTKAGLIPLHLWLPRAHPIAPSPVSALMSGVMLKTAIYGFVRFAFDFLGGGPGWWGYATLIAGAVSGVLGILYAIAEHDLKRLLAYSSVENIGVVFLALGTALVLAANHAPEWAALAVCAALLHSLNHAIFKSLLFLGAGALSDAVHTYDLEELGGLLQRMPVTGAAFLVGCCSIVGLPLFNGFVSEWLAFRSFAAGAGLANVPAAIVLPLATGVLALISGLAAACFAKAYGVAFLGRPRTQKAEHASEVPAAMSAAMVTLAVACVAIGVFPGTILRPLSVLAGGLVGSTAPSPELASLSNLLPWIAIAVAASAAGAALLRRTRRTTPTWACGLPGLDARMQYSSTAFSKPLRTVFAQVYRPERSVEVRPAGEEFFPAAISYRSVRTTSFERALYRPAVEAIISIGHRLRRLQTGNIQIYLLYVFLALIGVLVIMRLT